MDHRFPFGVQLIERVVGVISIPTTSAGEHFQRTAFDFQNQKSAVGSENEEIALTPRASVVVVEKTPANRPIIGKSGQQFSDLNLRGLFPRSTATLLDGPAAFAAGDDSGHLFCRCRTNVRIESQRCPICAGISKCPPGASEENRRKSAAPPDR
jgi:hypothetical protein